MVDEEAVGEKSVPHVPGIATRRKNGLQRPWDWLQIATWALFPLIIAHYFAFIYFLLWKALAARIVLTIVFLFFAISSFIAAYLTCTIDPADDVLCNKVSQHQTNPDDQIYCYLCETNVDATSKHCRYCDKCVVEFDHHCKWLNTCVGCKNYPYFLCIVASVFGLTLESLTLSIALMVESFANTHRFMYRIHHENDIHYYLGTNLSTHAVQSILVVSVTLMLCLVGLLIQLGGFHVVLLWKGLTTYDFIILEQKKQREREQEKLQRDFERQQQLQQRSSPQAANNTGSSSSDQNLNASNSNAERKVGDMSVATTSVEMVNV